MNHNERADAQQMGKVITKALEAITKVLGLFFGKELSYVIVILTSEDQDNPGYLIGSDIEDLDAIHKHMGDSLAQSKRGAMLDSVDLKSH